jgi:hypothetical protein
MPRKEFEAFTRLDASDVNTFLMDQSVMSFAGTAARGSAIATPVAGMTTYLEDSKNLEIYDGTSYASPSGMTLIATASPSASTEVIFNNVFSSAYQNYTIYFNISGTSAASLTARLISSGTPATTNYIWQYFEADGASAEGARDAISGSWNFGATRTSGRTFGTIEVSNPFAAAESSYRAFLQDPKSSASIQLRAGAHTTASSYDGIRIVPASGNITGSIRVYGVRN